LGEIGIYPKGQGGGYTNSIFASLEEATGERERTLIDVKNGRDVKGRLVLGSQILSAIMTGQANSQRTRSVKKW